MCLLGEFSLRGKRRGCGVWLIGDRLIRTEKHGDGHVEVLE